uniref:Uncharacterized protein n=1 Tax=Anguilla anguilla TaxID=7936 RepID=A0A0E9QDE9_ANGAN
MCNGLTASFRALWSSSVVKSCVYHVESSVWKHREHRSSASRCSLLKK